MQVELFPAEIEVAAHRLHHAFAFARPEASEVDGWRRASRRKWQIVDQFVIAARVLSEGLKLQLIFKPSNRHDRHDERCYGQAESDDD